MRWQGRFVTGKLIVRLEFVTKWNYFWINVIEEDVNTTPYLHSYASGDTVWITRFFIPPTLRGHHLGKMIVEKWEKNLPSHIRVIRLRAPDTDSARPCVFWSKLGFHYTESEEAPIYSEFEITRHTEMEKRLASVDAGTSLAA